VGGGFVGVGGLAVVVVDVEGVDLGLGIDAGLGFAVALELDEFDGGDFEFSLGALGEEERWGE
jgi:hypothetical protein